MTRTRVILADDHQLMLEGLKALLASEFEVVAVVRSGAAVLDAVLAHAPDVVLVDYGMPEKDGVEVIEELHRRGLGVPVVIVSARDDVACVRRALDAGARGYVLKHDASAELLVAIRAALAGTTFVAPAMAQRLFSMPSIPRADGPVIEALSPRQREILALLLRGLTAKEVGASLGMSPRTVESHKYKMMEQLRVKTSAELVRAALRLGFSP
jgi:DNA-binding NarL/FixJ family response regulator